MLWCFRLEMNKEKILLGFVFFAAILLVLYLHLVNPWNDFVRFERFSGNDPWYYYRLIDSCLKNFPERLWFDAFTYYPYGTYTHFGPFLVYFGAILVKIFGYDKIKLILSIIPVLGALFIIFPIYLLTRESFGKSAAIIAALLISVMPGQFLGRSILGFNDHHIWEVFWMVTTLALYVYAVNSGKIRNYALAGLAYGLYILTWAPGTFFGMLILVFVILSAILRWWLNFNETMIKGTMLMVSVAILIYLPFSTKTPYFSTAHYSPLQLLVLFAVLGSLFLLLVFEICLKKGLYAKIPLKSDKISYSLSVVLLPAVFVFLSFLFFPQLVSSIYSIVGVITPKGGALTIAEVQPFFTLGGQFTLSPAYRNFGTAFFFAVLGILYTVYLVLKEKRTSILLVLLWSIVMFVFLAGQNRFAYYFAAVTAVMASVFVSWMLKKLEINKLVNKALERSLRKADISYIKVTFAILLVILVFYPTFVEATNQSKYIGGINKQWYEALTWMRNNTPNAKFYDEYYYEIYKPPKNSGKPYSYPNGTYAVMSWWDYGHWIEAIAHRIPNANPFQQGIGSKVGKNPGAAPFFTAFTEEEANKIAERLGVKYVVSDVEMATGKFYAMAVWAENSLDAAWNIYYAGTGYLFITPEGKVGIAQMKYFIPPGSKALQITLPSENYYRTMEARLHIFDGNGLKRYRMVYESEPEAKGKNVLTMEMVYKLVYDILYLNKLKLPRVNVSSTGYVKVFEFVKGAKIVGKAPANVSEIFINTTIKTNQGRIIEYTQKVKVKPGNRFEIIVPYAQKTVYPVKPITPYYIKAGNITKTLTLSDADVENGNVIEINLT